MVDTELDTIPHPPASTVSRAPEAPMRTTARGVSPTAVID